MNRRSQYRDMEKYAACVRRWKAGYAVRTGAFKYKKRKWTEGEDEAVLAHSIPDRELSEKICRSVSAIMNRRCILKKGGAE